MKRVLQFVAIGQLALVVLIGYRIVEVLQIQAPTFEDVEQRSARQQLPPAPQRRPVGQAVVAAIQEKNLFETARGYVPPEEPLDDIVVDAAPLPPPTNVKLNGVMMLGVEPVALMTDTTAGAQQRRVRTGDMLGDYEVGEIGPRGVQLLGASGQEFAVALSVATGGAPPPRGNPRAPARPAARAPVRPTPPARGNPRSPEAAKPAGDTRSMTARERAEAARERAAQARARAAQARNERDGGNNQPDGKATPQRDPVQARLDALRRLREASRNR